MPPGCKYFTIIITFFETVKELFTLTIWCHVQAVRGIYSNKTEDKNYAKDDS